jgi:hypothetical protein
LLILHPDILLSREVSCLRGEVHISQLASRGGRRLKLRYLGTATNNAWRKRRTAALNLRNLIGRGLTRQHGTWALATT